ncbi:MAG: hypothetical protein JNK14_06810 [Chitinophagaceae bacterium]|nr:hypothetical protein [Chitinophagaceae bacterium]
MSILNHQRIAITGQSGIRITGSLKKFIEAKQREYKRNDINIVFGYYKVEEDMEKIFSGIDAADESIDFVQNPDKMTEILNLPYVEIKSYWDKALIGIIKRIEQSEHQLEEFHQIKISFIAFHSVFYHKRTNEYLSCVNHQLLPKLNLSKIITLIDDIFDIHTRLQKPRGLFYRNYQCSSEDLILDLMTIQDWRAKEVMISRYLTQQLNNETSVKGSVEFYVFAVKHPYICLENLIRGKPSAYLSHPISEVRRLEKKKEMKLVSELKEQMKVSTQELSDEFATFLPTTIDEFRIVVMSKLPKRLPKNKGLLKRKVKGQLGKEDVFYNVLLKRWDEELYLNPRDILYEYSGFSGIDRLWVEKITRNMECGTSTLLKALRSRISDQVTVRDYILVEQSKTLIVFRPIFNGNISGGVEEENEYFAQLAPYKLIEKAGEKNVYIYCPKADILKLIGNNFNAQLKHCITNKIFTCEDYSKQLKKDHLEEMYSKIAKAESMDVVDKNGLLNILESILINHYNVFYSNFESLKQSHPFLKISSPLPTKKTPLSGTEETIRKRYLDSIFLKEFLESFEPFYKYKRAKFIIPEETSNFKSFFAEISKTISQLH